VILEDQITKVVIDDYCEFNVKVLETTTKPPTTFPRRDTIGVGTASVGSFGSGVLFGEAQEVDIGDAIIVDFARVWAGSYETEAGASGSGSSAVRPPPSEVGFLNWGSARSRRQTTIR
jgi:hypothetical protein